MPLQPRGALIFYAHYVDCVTRDMALARMIAQYGQKDGYFFCYRLKDIVCDTPHGRLTLLDQEDRKTIAYMMGMQDEFEKFNEMLEYSVRKAKFFDPEEWEKNMTLTSQSIQDEIQHRKNDKDSVRERVRRYRDSQNM